MGQNVVFCFIESCPLFDNMLKAIVVDYCHNDGWEAPPSHWFKLNIDGCKKEK